MDTDAGDVPGPGDPAEFGPAGEPAAAEDPLAAGEQQLVAGEQQLVAGEQQLVAGERLLAGERLSVGDEAELAVSGVAAGGVCVAREPGGRVVFVRHALPGERVRARITEATASYARADVTEVMTASPDRVEPPCPYARPGGCGGCDWQHASLAAQRQLKAEVITGQLRRIAGIDQPVTVEPLPGEEDGLGWRTRVRFSVGRDGTAGLLAHRSHDVVPVADCLIAHPLVSQQGVTARQWPGVSSVEVAVSPESGQVAVSSTRGRGVPHRRTGPAYLRRHAAGRDWRTAPSTFWQVHPAAAEALTAAALAAAEPLPGEVALDVYCGAGLFTSALAQAVGATGLVVGVESGRAAARDARHNLRRFPWTRVHIGEAAAVLARGGWPSPQLAVLDPPRTGLPPQVIEALLATGPRSDGDRDEGAPAGRPDIGRGPGTPAGRPDGERASGARPGGGALSRVVYLSCDPATLARDVAVFAGHGWRLATLRAFDAFPMTQHVECLALLVPG